MSKTSKNTTASNKEVKVPVAKTTKAKAAVSKDTQAVKKPAAKLVIPSTEESYWELNNLKKAAVKKKPVVKKDSTTKVAENLKSTPKEELVKTNSVLTEDKKIADSEELKQQEVKVEISDKDINKSLIKDETKSIQPKLMSVKDLFEGMRKVQNPFLHR